MSTIKIDYSDYFFVSDMGITLLSQIKNQLNNQGFVIISGFEKKIEILFKLAPFLTCKIYESERLGSFHAFEVDPFSTELSETINSGGFHTDFSTSLIPPKFVAIQCICTDVRHPFYGRNQIVSYSSIKQRFFEIYSDYDANFFDQIYIQHNYGVSKKIVKFLSYNQSHEILKYHSKLLDHDINEIKIDDVYVSNIINAIATEMCYDFVLNEGDILLFNNWNTLHKRGECTTTYKNNHWGGRFINSVRYQAIPPV